MKTPFITTVAAAALMAGGALAQDNTSSMQDNSSMQNDSSMWDMDWSALDTDKDDRISRNEFVGGIQSAWDRQYGGDQIGADVYEEDQMGDSNQFSAYDANKDEKLSSDEFSEGVFSEYDENEDDFWDEDERAAFDEYRDRGGRS